MFWFFSVIWSIIWAVLRNQLTCYQSYTDGTYYKQDNCTVGFFDQPMSHYMLYWFAGIVVIYFLSGMTFPKKHHWRPVYRFRVFQYSLETFKWIEPIFSSVGAPIPFEPRIRKFSGLLAQTADNKLIKFSFTLSRSTKSSANFATAIRKGKYRDAALDKLVVDTLITSALSIDLSGISMDDSLWIEGWFDSCLVTVEDKIEEWGIFVEFKEKSVMLTDPVVEQLLREQAKELKRQDPYCED